MKKIILMALLLSGCNTPPNPSNRNIVAPVGYAEIEMDNYIPIQRFCDRSTMVYVRGNSIAVIPQDKYCSQNGAK